MTDTPTPTEAGDAFLRLGRFVTDCLADRGLLTDPDIAVALPAALDRVAVLTEERDAAMRERDAALILNAAHERAAITRMQRVAALEAGLREWLDAHEAAATAGYSTIGNAQYRLSKAHLAAREVLGGVPATKEEQT